MSEEEKENPEEELQPPAIGGTFLTMAFMLWIIINPELRDFYGRNCWNCIRTENLI